MKTTKADGGRRQLLTHIIAREAWYLVLDTEERKNFHCLAIMRHAAHTIRRTLDYLNERERRAFIAECRRVVRSSADCQWKYYRLLKDKYPRAVALLNRPETNLPVAGPVGQSPTLSAESAGPVTGEFAGSRQGTPCKVDGGTKHG